MTPPPRRFVSAASTLAALALLAATAVMQIRYAILAVPEFNWLAYLDADLIYQVERFLVNMGYPGVAEINSSLADYGSEFSLLAPPFRALAFLLPGTGPIQGYYFLFLVHLGCSLLALVILWRLLLRAFQHPPSAALFLALCLSSNLFVHNMAFLKPDANVVLLALACAYAALARFLDTGRTRWLALCLAAAGLGAAVKWWGVFVLFPAAYALADRDARGVRRAVRLLLPVFFPLACLAGLVLYLANPVTVPLTGHFLDAATGDGTPLAAATIRALLQQTVRQPFPWHGKLPWLLGAACLAAAGVSLALWRGRERLCRLRGPGAAVVNLCSAAAPFGFFTLLFDAPFLLSPQVFFSLKDYGSYNVFEGGHGMGGSALLAARVAGNLWGWVTDAFVSGFFSPVLLPALLLAGFLALRGVKDAALLRWLRCQACFLGAALAFLFLLVTKKNWATEAMLLPFLLFFLFTAFPGWLAGLPAPRRKPFALLLTLLAAGQLALNFLATPDILDFYDSRRGLPQEIVRINARLDAILREAGAHGTLSLVNRDFPMTLERPFQRVKHDAFDLQLKDLVTRARPGDVFVLDANRATAALRPLLDAQETLGVIRGKRYGRDGASSEKDLYLVLRKPEPASN